MYIEVSNVVKVTDVFKSLETLQRLATFRV